MEFKITGRVVSVLPLNTGMTRSGNPFQNRGIRVNIADNPQSPNLIEITFSGTRTVLLDRFNPGDFVEVYFSIFGREYNGRCYHNLYGSAIDFYGVQPQAFMQPAQYAQPQQYAQPAPQAATDQLLQAMTGQQLKMEIPQGPKTIEQIIQEGAGLPF